MNFRILTVLLCMSSILSLSIIKRFSASNAVGRDLTYTTCGAANGNSDKAESNAKKQAVADLDEAYAAADADFIDSDYLDDEDWEAANAQAYDQCVVAYAAAGTGRGNAAAAAAATAAIAATAATAAAAAAASAICANCDNNWVATHAKADAVKYNATIKANNIKQAAHVNADADLSSTHAAANAAKTAAGLPGYSGTWVIADWVAANAYSDADWNAANALADADWTAANALIAAIWTASNASADAERTAARAVDAATFGRLLSLVPATVKAYNDCIGIKLSDTSQADADWAASHTKADADKNSSTVKTRTTWNAAHHAADADKVASRAVGYTGYWVIADWVAANAYADAQFVAGNALTAANWTAANAATDAARVAANVAYIANASKVAADEKPYA